MEERSEVFYRVNYERGIVACVLTGCKYIALHRIEKYAPHVYAWEIPGLEIDDTYVGVAKCAPDDEFDLEYGKQLALVRAKAKRCKAINEAVDKAYSILSHEAKELAHRGIHKIPKNF